MNQLPPPGYVPPKPAKKRAEESRFTFGEAFRTTAKVASGFNKVATIQGWANIAHEIRRVIRG